MRNSTRRSLLGEPMSRPYTYWLWILLVILIAFGLRMWHLNSESIWHDEGWSIRAFRGPFTTPDDNTPYLYYLSGHLLWKLGGGESALALRYISVLIGTFTTAVSLWIGRKWFNPRAGIVLGLLVGLSPLLWEYSQEVRAYVAVPLIALGLIAGADILLKHKKGEIIPRNTWGLVFAVELAGLYTHNLSVPLIVWLNITLGIVWLLRLDWQHMKTWAGVQITLIVCYIPWLLTQSPSGTPLNTPPEPGFDLARDIWHAYFLPVLPQLVSFRGTSDLIILLMNFLAILLIVAGFALIFLHRTYRTWILISHVVLVPALSTALMLAANIDFHPRYYIAAVPGTLFLLVAGIEVNQRLSNTAMQLSGAVIVGLFGLITAFSLNQITTTRAYQHDDFAGLADYYATLPENTAILIPFNVERALQDYFAEQEDFAADFINIPLYSDEETAVQAIENLIDANYTQIELLTWFQLPADPRGMYPCLLSAASSEVKEEQFYFGLSTQHFDLDSLNWQSLELDPNYRHFEYKGAAYGSSAGGTCIRTSWSLDYEPAYEASVALTVQSPLGDEIARSDGLIANEENVGILNWGRYEIGDAYSLIKLPEGAPEDDYTLTLNIYNEVLTSGFDVYDPSGTPIGKTYVLADALHLEGPPLETIPEQAQVVNTSAAKIETGIPFDMTLMLPPNTETITLEGDRWTVGAFPEENDQAQLSWQRFIVAPGNSGEAILKVDDVEVARYEVIDIERRFDPPNFDRRLNVEFPSVGTLVGVTIQEPDDDPEYWSSPGVTLIWQADGETEKTYTVFVQMVTNDGHVIAQSDMQPVGNTRPTTSWVEGEYIVDEHRLTWHQLNYKGYVQVIAGLYDANNNFQRVLTSDGRDFALLSESYEVETP